VAKQPIQNQFHELGKAVQLQVILPQKEIAYELVKPTGKQ